MNKTSNRKTIDTTRAAALLIGGAQLCSADGTYTVNFYSDLFCVGRRGRKRVRPMGIDEFLREFRGCSWRRS